MTFDTKPMRIAGVFTLILLCSACAAGGVGVDIPPGAEGLDTCAVVMIDVEDLASDAAPDCNLEGSFLVLPGPVRLAIPDVGDVEVHEDAGGDEGVTYQVVNWGVPGVGAATVGADKRAIHIWGSTPEAVGLQREQLRISDVTVTG